MVSMATVSEGHTMWASGPGMSSLECMECGRGCEWEAGEGVSGRWERV